MSGLQEVVIYLVGFCLYFIPSLIAHAKKSTNRGYVYAINFFLGWSFIGWIIALIMALRG